jgi:hypothetical protein
MGNGRNIRYGLFDQADCTSKAHRSRQLGCSAGVAMQQSRDGL